ncbi:MAG: GldG family protein [Oscillospiraceae bacterium]|jgi:hypothetical protein|nr:GldG family protein [Oscillospiraceae bacterium]
MNKKKLKYGGFSLLVIVVFLTAVILLNVLAGMLTGRFYLKADLTESGLYSLSDKAVEVLEGIDETVDLIVLSDESAWLAHATWVRIVDILQNYSAMTGGRIRVQYVNPALNSFNGPEFGNSLSQLKEAYPDLEGMKQDDIILLSARRAITVPVSNLFSWSYDSYGQPVITGVNADQELVSALLYVLSEQVARAVFLEGHNENPAEVIRFLFERFGYACSSLTLALEDIPDDTVVVVSSAPKTDFLSEEIGKLEDYLAAGGNAMIFYDFNTLSLPRLDGFLEQWGVTVDSHLVCDEQYSLSADFSVIVAGVRSGLLPSLSAAEAAEKRVALYLARPVRSLWANGQRGSYTALPFIQTFSSSSYAKDFGGGQLTTPEREDGDLSGPFALGYDIRRASNAPDGSQVFAHMIVSSAGLIDDTFLSYYGQSFYNLELMADFANDFNPFGQSVYIPSKQIVGAQVPVSAGQARAVLLLMVIALPLIIILLGILVWRRRRHQ